MHNIPKYEEGTSGGGISSAIGAASGASLGLSGVMKGATGGPWGMAGAAADTISSFLPLKTEYSGDKGAITAGMDSAYDTISNVAMSINPIIGGAMKAGKLVGGAVNALGGGTDGMTTTDAILGSAFFNLTPMGMINGFGGKKADKFTKDTETFATMGSSYGGTENMANNAAWKSGKKYGLFSSSARKKANAVIREAGRLQGQLANMAEQLNMTNEVLANQSSLAEYGAAYEQAGGFDATNSLRAAKEGMKVETPFKFDYSCLDNQIQEFKEGGAMNVIPEGALHAHKHHMENDENITKKGIPVVIEGEGGELLLLAEIEREEIIFNKELTVKLENFYKEFYDDNTSKSRKDEIALEAGKLLADEIINNTNDRTGLIDRVE